MGKITRLTKEAQFGDASTALNMINTHNQDKSAGIDYAALSRGNLWGSLTVYDKKNNPHKKISYAIRNEQTKDSAHIEVLLLDRLKEFLQSTESGLSWCKVVVFIDQSPCTDCTANMVQRCGEIADLVTDGSYIDFSFVFSKFYARNVGANSRHNLFSSKDTAKLKYKNISGEYTTQNTTEFRIRIRHLQATKPLKNAL